MEQLCFESLKECKISLENNYRNFLSTMVHNKQIAKKYEKAYLKSQRDFLKLARNYYQNNTLTMEEIYKYFERELKEKNENRKK